MYHMEAGTILIILGMLNFAVPNIEGIRPRTLDDLMGIRWGPLEKFGDRISKEEAILAGLPNHLAEFSKREIKDKKIGIFESENHLFVPDFPDIHFVIFQSNYSHLGINNIPGSRLVYVTDCRNVSNNIFDECCGYVIVPDFSEMRLSYNNTDQHRIRLFNSHKYYILNRSVSFKKIDIVRGLEDSVVNTLKEYNDKTVQNNIRRFLNLQQPLTFKILVKLLNGHKIE